ncbi:MAG TPA: sulfatase-like hydrolase/transferase [Myxococcota bacterium]|nr:sulfatase-like hydrolase/transferase [Myxococcota bacterium]
MPGALRALAFAALLALGCGAQAPRHLVIVSLDTLRADALALYGSARPTSPQLERFAQHAFVFENAVAPANATTASHHALFQSRSAGDAMASRDTAPTLATWLKEQGFRTAAFTGGGTLSRAAGFARGFDVWDERSPELAVSVPKALAFLDEAAERGDRTYLFVHCFDVHLPYDPPPPYNTVFDPAYRGGVTGRATLPLLRGVRRIFEQAHLPEPPRLDAADREKIRALYDGEVASADALLAPLLARLDAPDLRESTVVVILSDHGEEFWEHGSVLHAHTLYQELLHVPLLLRAPGRDGGVRIAARVSLLDVVPTLLQLLGVPAPPDAQGRSLVPLLDGAAEPPRPVFAEGFAFDAKLQAVIDGDAKAIRRLDTGEVALYDLAADPAEQRDLAAARPAERERLRALLDGALGRAHASQSPALPADVEPATQERLRQLGYID